ncbi:sensor histidine kinase [Streptomyces sp. NRRL B-3648]|uniref:sensor histidine kinase n=1 Tax=Streptomyces sp. NRRL B-3648 TaxID=1519493 RepID=UPI0006AEE978|nr:sensor histidine kinase [Streptomyces sp. NRRL B-3648]KOX05174.1 histidine kinase [Streptomyces sp. NRRL B-3648]
MHTTARPRRALTRPFRGVGRPVAFLATGVLIQLGVLLVLALPWILFVPVAMWAVLLAVLAPTAAVALAGPLLTAAQHGRFRTRLGVDIPSPYAGRRPGLPEWIRSPAGRRQLMYHLLDGPLLALAAAFVMLMWTAAGAAVSVYAWLWLVPVDWRAGHPGYSTWAAYVTAGGAALLYLAAWLSGALSRLDTRVGTVLLGPSREEQLARRVDDLTESRAGLVDAVDAERRRIERDLHDGAQQRLVSLAVNLGLARVTLGDLPEDARRVIDEAHREAKEAIEELSGLVRGLHPAVLEDRGLDAAISGVAARAPVPVRVRVDLPARPSPTIEAVAYFVVSEALTNVVKHAEASGAEVTVERFGPTLLVVVSDDGVGGADPAGGTGLAGLAKRVAAVDGTLSVDSPVGGPTVMTVELPCVP